MHPHMVHWGWEEEGRTGKLCGDHRPLVGAWVAAVSSRNYFLFCRLLSQPGLITVLQNVPERKMRECLLEKINWKIKKYKIFSTICFKFFLFHFDLKHNCDKMSAQ